jgi:hypothetical protein
VLVHCGCGIARDAQRARQAAQVGNGLLRSHGGAQGVQRPVDVADPEIQRAERRELNGAFVLLSDAREQFQGFGMQTECTVELAERDQAKAIVVEHRRI